MNVLIIEDEPFAQQELARLLKVVNPEIQILQTIDSVEEAAQYLASPPAELDIIFMDIELSDDTCFEIFNRVEVKLPVIFTTAYNEYAIRAFRVNAIDYLLKPIEEQPLRDSLRKWEMMSKVLKASLDSPVAQLEGMMKAMGMGYKNRFLVSVGDKFRYLESDQIAYFFAEDNTVFLYTFDKKRYVLNYNLEQLDNVLDPKNFFRITRKYIVNIKAVGDVHRYFNSRLKVMLTPPVEDEVLISRVKVPEFLRWLDT